MFKYLALASALLGSATLATSAGAAAATITAVAPTQTVQFSVYLPLRNKAALTSLITAQQTKGSASYHKWLTPAQAAAQFGPTPATMAQAQAALQAAGLQVTAVGSRSITVTGTAGAINTAFRIHLVTMTDPTGASHVAAGTRPVPPANLASLGAIVPSFAPVPSHQTHSRIAVSNAPDNRNGPDGGYRYNDLKQAYDYPSYQQLDGTGVNVAIVISENALNSDVAAMFNHEHFTTTTGKAPPTFATVPVDGGASGGPGGEASLDSQMVLGGAPGATVSLVTIPDLFDNHILDAYQAIDDANTYDIVSSSFGGCESEYLPAYNNGFDFTYILAIYDEIFQYGASEGITFIASSGDSAGLECPSNNYFYQTPAKSATFVKGVESPASDPFVTAVGGTNLVTSYNGHPGLQPSTYVGENAFGDPEVPYDVYGFGINVSGGYWGAGGGLSQVFAAPPWQSFVNSGSSTARTVPDIGMQVGGCPGGLAKLPCGPDRSYVLVFIGGGQAGLIGTSVSAPEFAGALALLEQAFGGGVSGRAGALNPSLYEAGGIQIAAGGSSAPAADQFYHMNISGFDGAYSTTPTTGYNYMTGNGTPDVRNLFSAFGVVTAPAGNPQTPSNP